MLLFYIDSHSLDSMEMLEDFFLQFFFCGLAADMWRVKAGVGRDEI